MADPTQVSHNNANASTGSGDGLPSDTTTTAAAVPPSNPFLTSTSTTSGSQYQALDTPQHPLPNPFSPQPPAQQENQPEYSEPVPVLPPRPDYPLTEQYPDEMATTATAAPFNEPNTVQTPSPTAQGGERTQNEEQNVEDTAEIANLKAMFPDFDSSVMQSVLASVNHDQGRAIDVLLGMSDPSYVSAPPVQPRTEDVTDPASALALDEELARQLALEDEREAQRHHSRHRSVPGDQPPRATGQSWSRRASAGSQPPQTEGDKGDFQQDFQETVSRIAESGKRTFSSIVSKVKAKISEIEQNRNNQNQSSSSNQAHYDPYQSGANPNVPVDRHAASEAFAYEYYGAPANGPPTGNAAVGGWTSPAQEVRGYDVDEHTADRTATQPVGIPQPNYTPPPPATGTGFGASPGSDIPRPSATSTGSPINAAKLGILPKRPVSLHGTQPASAQDASSPTASSPRRDPEDDDLEYMENPFEEGRK